MARVVKSLFFFMVRLFGQFLQGKGVAFQRLDKLGIVALVHFDHFAVADVKFLLQLFVLAMEVEHEAQHDQEGNAVLFGGFYDDSK